MAQAILATASAGYSTGALVAVDVLTIPPTIPAIGTASILFILQSSTAWFSGTPYTYVAKFTPLAGDPIVISLGGQPTLGVTPMPITTSSIATYLGGIGVAEDTSGITDTVASGGVISLTSRNADAGVCAAVVLQADSPIGYQMRPVSLGSVPSVNPPPSVLSATIQGINKSTGPFISLLMFTAVNGGASPGFLPDDIDIVLAPLLDIEANNAVISISSYVSPTASGITPATWFAFPPSTPTFTVATAWTGATYAYGGTSTAIAYRPLQVLGATSNPSQASAGFSVIVISGAIQVRASRGFAAVVGD